MLYIKKECSVTTLLQGMCHGKNVAAKFVENIPRQQSRLKNQNGGKFSKGGLRYGQNEIAKLVFFFQKGYRLL
jgi:hypothetical protein